MPYVVYPKPASGKNPYTVAQKVMEKACKAGTSLQNTFASMRTAVQDWLEQFDPETLTFIGSSPHCASGFLT